MRLPIATDRNPSSPLRWRRKPTRRRGMSILVVLTIIMLAMAASYATLHQQSTMLAIAENGQSNADARQVAQAAMSLALRKMHVAAEWGGADSSFSGTFDSTQRYTVSYFTGITDAIGTAQLPDANDATATAEWPFCVTVVATGYATSDSNDSNETSHRVRCVVRLTNPTLQDTPSLWSVVSPFSLLQWANSDVEVQLPARIDGLAYTQGGWDFANIYPVDHELKSFAGMIDEVTIYNTALSQTQIEKANLLFPLYDYGIFNNLPFVVRLLLHPVTLPDPIARWKLNEADGSTTATDSAGSNHGTYYGAKPSSGTNSPGGRGAQFDGYNDIINLGKMDLSGSQVTILAWFKADNFNTTDGRIISKATSDSNSDHWWMISTINQGGDTRLRFRLKAGGSTQELIASSGNLSTNTWTYVAATYDGSTMRLYKDSALVGSAAKTGSIYTNSNAWVYLGGNPPGSARVRYLRDLHAMEQASVGNVKPLSNTLYLPQSRTDAETLSLLEEDLQASIVDTPAADVNSFISHPGDVSSYQLYPGSKSYDTTVLDASLSSVTLSPDVQTNPLGIYRRTANGNLTLNSNVSIQGTIITSGTGSNGDIEVSGTNVSLLPQQIPRLDGSGTFIQLPIAIVGDDFSLGNFSGLFAQGVISAGDDFRVEDGNDTASMEIQGKVIAKEFYVEERWQWDNKGGTWWRDQLASFLNQLSTPGAANYSPYFPVWLNNTQSLDPDPLIKIGPDPSSPTYHWHSFVQPLFTYDSDTESGLHWDIITWEDGA